MTASDQSQKDLLTVAVHILYNRLLCWCRHSLCINTQRCAAQLLSVAGRLLTCHITTQQLSAAAMACSISQNIPLQQLPTHKQHRALQPQQVAAHCPASIATRCTCPQTVLSVVMKPSTSIHRCQPCACCTTTSAVTAQNCCANQVTLHIHTNTVRAMQPTAALAADCPRAGDSRPFVSNSLAAGSCRALKPALSNSTGVSNSRTHSSIQRRSIRLGICC